MNRRIQIRRDPSDYSKPAALYEGVGRRANLDNYTPDHYLSRVWMGVVPPENGEPGYVAVLGEIFDPTQRMHERKVRVIDEGVALDPVDFTDAECKYYDIDPGSCMNPTKTRLMRAVVGLKDLYWPQRCILPPESPRGSTGYRGDRAAPPFTEFVRRADGLMYYNSEYGTRHYRKWYPFFQSTQKTIDGVVEAQQEDRDYNLSLIDAMYDSNLLFIYSHCTIYNDQQLVNSRRCVGMVLAEMEMTSAAYMQKPVELRSGYAEPTDEDDMEDLLDQEEIDRDEVRKWVAGRKIEDIDASDEPIFGGGVL